jgi:hypothetical protein
LTITLDHTELAAGQRLTGTVRGEFGGDVVRLLWVDGAGRVAGAYAVDVPRGGTGEALFSIAPPPHALGQKGTVVVVRASKEAVRAAEKERTDAPFRSEAQAAFRLLKPLPAWDEYVALIGDGAENADPRFWSSLAASGVSGAVTKAFESPGQCVQHDMPFFSDALPNKANPLRPGETYEAAHGEYLESRDASLLARKPPIFNDEALGKAQAAIAKSVAIKEQARPLGWSLGDDLSLTSATCPFDYDMSADTVAVFRTWLQDRYRTLSALNAQWGTQYEGWHQVRPPTTDETKSTLNPVYAERLKELVKPPEPALAAPQLETRDGARGFSLKPEELREPGGENASAWSDWREFNDFAFARVLREYRAFLTQLEQPAGEASAEQKTRVGLWGVQPPAAWGGWDWAQLARSVDWVEEHESVLARELYRSLAAGAPVLSRFSVNQEGIQYRLWDRWLRGDMGCVLAGQAQWFPPPEFQPAPAAKEFLGDVRRLTEGLGALREAARPHSRGVAVYYSPQSVRLHWLLDSEGDGSWWLKRDGAHEAAHSSALLQLNAWLALLEDLGYAPRFANEEQLLAGKLSPRKGAGGVKVLVLPKVLSLSDAEADALRKFVRAGGVVIADGECGTFDGHGKRRERMFLTTTIENELDAAAVGALDRDFGLARRDLRALERNGAFAGDASARVKLVEPNDPVPSPAQKGAKAPAGPVSPELRVLEPGVIANGARSHGVSGGGAAALLTKAHGRGLFVYLNLSLQDYAQRRLTKDAGGFAFQGMSAEEYAKAYGQPTGGEALRLVIGDILNEALPGSELQVRTVTGTPARGVRRVCFDLGKERRLFGLMRSAGDGGGALDAWVGLEGRWHWYNARDGVYLGCEQSVKVALEPHRAAVLAALPYAVERIAVKVRRSDPRGVFKITLALVTKPEECGTHVLRLEARDPSGNVMPQYACTVVAEDGRWNGEIAFGLNEPVGEYRLLIRDVLTGKTAEAVLGKLAAEYTNVTGAK